MKTSCLDPNYNTFLDVYLRLEEVLSSHPDITSYSGIDCSFLLSDEASGCKIISVNINTEHDHILSVTTGDAQLKKLRESDLMRPYANWPEQEKPALPPVPDSVRFYPADYQLGTIARPETLYTYPDENAVVCELPENSVFTVLYRAVATYNDSGESREYFFVAGENKGWLPCSAVTRYSPYNAA